MIKKKSIMNEGQRKLKRKSNRAHQLVRKLNNMDVDEDLQKIEIINEYSVVFGESPSIEHNFHCDLGYNIHVGHQFYAGYNCTILDMAEVRIGDHCMIGPNVGIYTAGHSLSQR